MGQMIELTASDGHQLSAYRADPSGAPRGGLVVVQEIFGVNSHIRQVCDGFAADGYLAIAPAMFDRLERGVDLGYSPETIAVGRDLRARSNLDDGMKDVAAAAAASASAGKIGVVGYCYGGLVAWVAAARVPGLACSVAYYGGGILGHIEQRPSCPVMLHFGERDDMLPLDGVKRLAAAHPTQVVHVYAADHGFNCDQRGSYDAAAAKLARERTLSFLREHLG
ncbi:MAG TPA: dienelactone hydrolase family protein [Kofleriaceae bacterium]|nr:dienelactone hydrolase family protein [Kofleriaceae bacterium]